MNIADQNLKRKMSTKSSYFAISDGANWEYSNTGSSIGNGLSKFIATNVTKTSMINLNLYMIA